MEKEKLPIIETGKETIKQSIEQEKSLEEKIKKEEKKEIQERKIQQSIEEIREKIRRLTEEPPIEESIAKLPSQEERKEYQSRHIPDYLQDTREKAGLLNRIVGSIVNFFKRYEISDKEILPEKGPFFVITNHFGGETPILFSLLRDYDHHIAAGEELNWKRSKFRAWLLRKMRMISVEESLANLSSKEKEELLERIPGKVQKEGYAKIIEREKQGKVPTNTKFIREATALLSRGDVVVMYPEGLFLYGDKPELKKGYQGIELIARKYKDLTGKELPIVPVAIYKEAIPGKKKERKRVRVGKPLLLSENKTDLSGTDWSMSHLAELLPEEQRGYYKSERFKV